MRIFGFEVSRRKANLPPGSVAVPAGGGWWGLVRESFAGAWQANVEVDSKTSLLAFSAIFACVTMIANDIAKLRIKLMRLQRAESGKEPLWLEEQTGASPFLPLFSKPNHYQNRMQFVLQWIVSKLLWGNVYVLKRRDLRGLVRAGYVLDPQRVKPLIAPSGDIYYELATDNLSKLVAQDGRVVVPASEIIHDLMNPLWHPLVGVSPIYACGSSATLGNKIQANSARFFANSSRPSGVLTAPGAISDETAGRIKTLWETNFSGEKIGRLAVLGDGLKYEAMTIPAADAQLIEQLRWTVEDVARAFHVPMYKLGGAIPSGLHVEALSQMYYNDCLQSLIEALEAALDEGFELPADLAPELDLRGLLRMDTAARFDANNKAVSGGWLAPNEARRWESLAPADGGDSPMMQQQNWTLAQLAQRKAPVDAPSVAPAPQPVPAPETPVKAVPEDTSAVLQLEAVTAELMTAVKRMSDAADRAQRIAEADREAEEFAAVITEGLSEAST
jgi:HK97 family phage portal protein